MDKKIYHSFDIAMAKGYGLHAAIVFNYIKIRIEHLKSLGCEKHGPSEIHHTWLKEGLCNSTDLLLYISVSEFIEAVESLQKFGLILVNHLSEEHDWSGDIWYAITDED